MALDAEIAGLDKQIGLYFNEIYDVKWRTQAFGSVSTTAVEAMERRKDYTIKLRGQREALFSQAKANECTAVFEDHWDAHVRLMDKVRAVRDSSQPEGYGLLNFPSERQLLDAYLGEEKTAEPSSKR